MRKFRTRTGKTVKDKFGKPIRLGSKLLYTTTDLTTNEKIRVEFVAVKTGKVFKMKVTNDNEMFEKGVLLNLHNEDVEII